MSIINFSSSSLPAEVYFSVADMFEAYANACSSGKFDAWPAFFTSDAIYRVTSRENFEADLAHGDIYCDGRAMIEDRADALRDSTVYEPRSLRHILSHPRLRATGDGVLDARTNFLIVEAMSDAEPQIYMAGTYEDEIVSEDKRLKFRKRVCVYDNYRIRTSLVHPV